jgi:hypothetical protein
VLRIGGEPAADTFVHVDGPAPAGSKHLRWEVHGRTDPEGLIRFTGLPEGTAQLGVAETGFLMTRAVEVALRAATTTRARVREEPGRPVTVLVRDERGDPLAGARVDLSFAAPGQYVRLEGDVQQVGFLTDRDGRVFFPRLPEGRVGVSVTIGTRYAYKAGEAGESIEVRLASDR